MTKVADDDIEAMRKDMGDAFGARVFVRIVREFTAAATHSAVVDYRRLSYPKFAELLSELTPAHLHNSQALFSELDQLRVQTIGLCEFMAGAVARIAVKQIHSMSDWAV